MLGRFTRRPGYVVLLLALYLAAQAGVLLHRAFVPHGTCPLDGEVAHVHASAHAAAHAEERGASEPSTVAVEGEGEGHEEHCELASATPPQTRTSAPRLACQPRCGEPLPIEPRATEGHVEERRFLLAPKQSPPAVFPGLVKETLAASEFVRTCRDIGVPPASLAADPRRRSA